MDNHSYARPAAVRVTHLALDLELDFERRQARGSVNLHVDRREPAAPLILDAKGLVIDRVVGANGRSRRFELGAGDPILGSPLTIDLEAGDREVRVHYRTTPESDAMQWLAPQPGSTRPFLFTQGQAILTRTWIPCQDTPGNRVTYEAKVRAPEGLTTVMSAEQLGQDEHGTWHFRLTKPVPPYLIALACGELAFEPISSRCGVYAEPGVAAKAAAELADTEKMIAAAEALFGPYRWGRYDLLVLPPAFPFGGMENPCLTFATPTILAGDKSLVNLVAHELAHSWSGNLVTNATWSDFWLNEGFTVYFEGRIMEAVYDVERARMEQLVALGDLEREMAALPSGDQVLHLDLNGRNPDDGMTQVAYEKGAWFLRTVEAMVGRGRLDAFLRDWFDSNAFRSVTTADLERFLRDRLLSPGEYEALQVDAWLTAPGIPTNASKPHSALLAAVEAALPAGGVPPAQQWVTQQWLHYLNRLPDSLTPEQMGELDAEFGLTSTGNSEVLAAWLVRATRAGYRAADARCEQFLLEVGRRKFLKPIYEELVKTPEGKTRAQEIYARARPRYHAVATRTLDAIVR